MWRWLAVLLMPSALTLALADAGKGQGTITTLQGAEPLEPDLVTSVRGKTLYRELARPENFPAYVYQSPISTEYQDATSTKIGRYLIDEKDPKGAVACSHIRIISGQGDAPLDWADHNTAASNVYFHIHKAIDYFRELGEIVGEKIGPSVDETPGTEAPPVTIRVDMNVMWAMFIKFSGIELHNISYTTPDGEIWFHTPKRAFMPKYIVFRYLPGLQDTFLGTAGFPMDAARVPTIVYHEWVHHVTARYLGIKKTTALGEGFANYFGSVIGGRPEMGVADEFSTLPYQRRFDKQLWQATLDDERVAGSDFIATFFWRLRDYFGPMKADALAWRTVKQLHPESGLADVRRALIGAAPGILLQKELKELEALTGHVLANFR